MNNVEIVIDYYLHITSHVSHAVTSCTHYTSYSLLNLVHDIVCEFGLAIQDYMFLCVDTKYVHWLIFIYISPHMYLKLLLVAHTTQVTIC